MFGFFKKKKPSLGKADDRSHEVLFKAAILLKSQLMLCSARKDEYEEFIHSNFVRGYFIGFFDASLQYANIPINDNSHLLSLISAGHQYLFENRNSDKTLGYVMESSFLSGEESFDKAQTQGGEEYFKFLNGETRSPNGLSERFHNVDLDKT